MDFSRYKVQRHASAASKVLVVSYPDGDAENTVVSVTAHEIGDVTRSP